MIEIINMTKDHIPFFTSVRNECAVEYLHNSNTFSVQQVCQWFDKNKPDYYIILHEKSPIGYFRVSQHSEENRNLYIGADLHKDFHGKGLAYESYCKFIPFIMKKYNLHKVSLEVLGTNQRAYNLYFKLGFVQEGIKRQEVLKCKKYIDSIIMSILKEEMENSKIYTL